MLNGWWPTRRTWAVAALAAGAFAFAIAVVFVSGRGPVLADLGVTRALNEWATASESRFAVWRAVTRFGEGVVLIPLYALVVVLCSVRRAVPAAVVAVVSGLTYPLLSNLVKLSVNRPRPAVDAALDIYRSSSFPSGHTGAAMCFATVVFLVVGMALPGWWRAVGATVFVIPALVALSRMALGVHYPTDVAGAIALGGLWPIVVAAIVGAVHNGWIARRNHAAVSARVGSGR